MCEMCLLDHRTSSSASQAFSKVLGPFFSMTHTEKSYGFLRVFLHGLSTGLGKQALLEGPSPGGWWEDSDGAKTGS